jgi:hypothetical protein
MHVLEALFGKDFMNKLKLLQAPLAKWLCGVNQ